MTIYGQPTAAPAAPAHAAPELPSLTPQQNRLRIRVCAGATSLHDRLVVLADVLTFESDDKEAVRRWLFAHQADEVHRPTGRPQWTGEA